MTVPAPRPTLACLLAGVCCAAAAQTPPAPAPAPAPSLGSARSGILKGEPVDGRLIWNWGRSKAPAAPAAPATTGAAAPAAAATAGAPATTAGPASATAATAAGPAGAGTAPAATAPAAAAPAPAFSLRGLLADLPPPSGKPLSDARKADAPGQGVALPTGAGR